jgi:RHS repeat-associated protein
MAAFTSAVNYPYDANGAMTGDGLRRYEFDAAGRLANVTTGAGVDAPTTRYVHNALGQRLFKTEPQFAPVSSGSNPADPGVMQALIDFFGSLWGSSPTSTSTVAAPTAGDKLGYQYYYDEDGSLLYELGSGGANSTGSAHYVYLPTPAGPMPIATYTGSKHYAVHTDHLNTPRRLTQSNKQVAWQWAFSAFGDEQPTTAKNRFVDPTTTPNAGSTTIADVTFNLRYSGQYADKESGLYYNARRSYCPTCGRYTQPDPISLAGGWNKFAYVDNNPLMYSDPLGLAKRKLDPNSQECKDLREKIRNIRLDISERIRDLASNPGNLPYYPPNANSLPRESVRGHEDLLRDARDNLKDREKQYDDKCGDDEPPPPPTEPASACGDTCKRVLVQVAGAAGTLFWVWRSLCAGPY